MVQLSVGPSRMQPHTRPRIRVRRVQRVRWPQEIPHTILHLHTHSNPETTTLVPFLGALRDSTLHPKVLTGSQSIQFGLSSAVLEHGRLFLANSRYQNFTTI